MFETSETAGAACPTVPDEDAAYLSPPAALLVRAVVGLRAQAAVDLPGPQALAETAVLLREAEKLRVVLLARLADVDRRQLHSLDGAASTHTWVARQQSGLDRHDVTLARRLGRLPVLSGRVAQGGLAAASAGLVAAALARLSAFVDRPDGLLDGQPAEAVLETVITLGVLDTISEARGGLADDDPLAVLLSEQLASIWRAPSTALGRLEEALVVLAEHLEPAMLPSALSRIVDALLPLEHDKRVSRAQDDRGLDLQLLPDGSGWRISRGELDLETGELLWTVLQAELATDPAAPADTAAAAAHRDQTLSACGGDEESDAFVLAATAPCTEVRSLRQRRHDALRLALRRYLDSGIAGLRDKVAPHLSVTVTLDRLEGRPGAMPAASAAGTALPDSLLRRWTCDSAITRFVLSRGRRVLHTSHTERTLKAHERRVKHLEAGGRCEAAGCWRGPGHPLIPHHAVPFALSRTTSLTDTVLLCEQTHRDLHERGRPLRLKSGRWLGPTGWLDGP